MHFVNNIDDTDLLLNISIFDLVILDISFPAKCGIDLLINAEQNFMIRQCKIFVHTQLELKRSIADHMHEYVIKDLHFENLRNKLEEHFS